MPNEVVIVDPSGDLSIGMEQITLDTCPSLAGAKRILDSGRNVIVQPSNQWYRNTCYVEYWNRYAQSLNLWVKFDDDINPDDEGITIIVM